jgi:hypothetical protein
MSTGVAEKPGFGALFSPRRISSPLFEAEKRRGAFVRAKDRTGYADMVIALGGIHAASRSVGTSRKRGMGTTAPSESTAKKDNVYVRTMLESELYFLPRCGFLVFSAYSSLKKFFNRCIGRAIPNTHLIFWRINETSTIHCLARINAQGRQTQNQES